MNQDLNRAESIRKSIQENWIRLQDQVRDACDRCHRAPTEITIIGVTKYVDDFQTASLLEAGCHDLGESRPQSLWNKAKQIESNALRWHLIGHLQRNKVKRTLPLVHLIHSVDSERLLLQIEEDSEGLDRSIEILIEVNVTSDSSKTGVKADLARRLLEVSSSLKRVKVTGLMGMATLDGTSDQAQRDFASLRALRDELVSEFHVTLPQLSMGMSGDFSEAIAEGSTMIRIGSMLFEADHGNKSSIP